MAALPYIQLYVADYLADTMHLSAEEHGAYLLIIMNYWQTGRAIPKRRLPSIARIPSERWTDVENTLSEFFTETPTGEWFHGRIEEDLLKVRGKSESASAAGRASAAKRASVKNIIKTAHHNDRSTNVGDPLQRKSNHTDTDTDTDTDTEKRKIKTLGDLSIADDEAFKAFWAAYPRKTNQAAARRAWKKHGPGILPVVFADIEARFRAGDWAADRKEFIPHPATYLNGSRWLDDIIPRGRSNGASRPIDKPRSPADRLRAIRAAEQAERESHGQVVDGDAEHFRPPVREQLRHDTAGRMDYDPGGDHPANDGRRN